MSDMTVIGASLTTLPTNTKTILVINPDGIKTRDDRPLTELDRDELLVVIDELVDLIRRQ